MARAFASSDDVYFDDEAEETGPSYALGLYGLWTGMDQGPKSFTAEDSTKYQTGGYMGQSLQGGVFLDMSPEAKLSYRSHLSYQSLSLHGSSTQGGFPIPAKSGSTQRNPGRLGR